MPRWAAYLFLSLFLTVMVRPIAPFLSYRLHQDYIAQVLCENRAKPEMHCNGACHLRKMVKASSPTDSAPAPSKMAMEDFPAFLLYKSIALNPVKLSQTWAINDLWAPNAPLLLPMGKPPQDKAYS